MIDFGTAVDRRRLSRVFWPSVINHYGGRMQYRRGYAEETEDIHEMGHQNKASLGGFLSVLW